MPLKVSLKIYSRRILQNLTPALMLYQAVSIYLVLIQIPLVTVNVISPDKISALRSMPNNKTPSNDTFSKEFWETFWDDLKDGILNPLK